MKRVEEHQPHGCNFGESRHRYVRRAHIVAYNLSNAHSWAVLTPTCCTERYTVKPRDAGAPERLGGVQARANLRR